MPLLALPGCMTPRPEWREIKVPPQSFDDVWTAVVQKAELNGFKPQIAGPDASDRGARVFHSRWVTREYGFRKTFRRRMHAEFEESDTEPGGWKVRLRVERQTVKDMARVLKPEDTDWSADGQDIETEQRIAVQVKMHLGMTEVVQPRERGR